MEVEVNVQDRILKPVDEVLPKSSIPRKCRSTSSRTPAARTSPEPRLTGIADVGCKKLPVDEIAVDQPHGSHSSGARPVRGLASLSN